jgi:hypothetical protein
MQNLHQSKYEHDILYYERSSDDGQLLIRPFLRKTKNTNMAGGWNLKLTFRCMETTDELLHLDKRSLVQ